MFFYFIYIFLSKISYYDLLDFYILQRPVALWSARKFYHTIKKKLQYTSRLRKYKWQTISQPGSLLRTRKRTLSDPLKFQKCEREVVGRLVYSRTLRSSTIHDSAF